MKKLQGNVSQTKRSPHAKIQAFSSQFFFSPKSSLSMVLHSPLQLIQCTTERSLKEISIQSKHRYLTYIISLIGEQVPSETDKIYAFSRCHRSAEILEKSLSVFV